MSKDKNSEKDLTQDNSGSNLKLTDFDVCELFIKCVSTYVETSSKLEIERGKPLEIGKELWKETVRTLKEYRESNRKTSSGV